MCVCVCVCVCLWGGGPACVPRRKISTLPHSHYSGEKFFTMLVGKVEGHYRVIHFKVKPACNPSSLNCICRRRRRRNVGTIVIEKQQFLVCVYTVISNK